MALRKYIVMDNDGVIQDADTLEELTSQEGQIRTDNPDISGDLVFAEILQVSK